MYALFGVKNVIIGGSINRNIVVYNQQPLLYTDILENIEYTGDSVFEDRHIFLVVLYFLHFRRVRVIVLSPCM